MSIYLGRQQIGAGSADETADSTGHNPLQPQHKG
jgi:hypothetical protein